jgi:acetyl-CoA synthetase
VADNAPTQQQTFPVPPSFAETARVNAAGYRDAYHQAATDPDAYWVKEAGRVAWMTFPTKIKNTSFSDDVSIKWFEDGVLNASVSCLDRHLAERGDTTAIIWEGDNPASSRHLSYRELHDQVCRLANAM